VVAELLLLEQELDVDEVLLCRALAEVAVERRNASGVLLCLLQPSVSLGATCTVLVGHVAAVLLRHGRQLPSGMWFAEPKCSCCSCVFPTHAKQHWNCLAFVSGKHKLLPHLSWPLGSSRRNGVCM